MTSIGHENLIMVAVKEAELRGAEKMREAVNKILVRERRKLYRECREEREGYPPKPIQEQTRILHHITDIKSNIRALDPKKVLEGK